jgi:imidazoleglycerol phosphate dehydratase HisB
MAYTFDQLKGLTVVELRKVASGVQHEAVQGYTQLNKEHLLVALSKALEIPMHAHHDVIGIDKQAIKAEMKALKQARAAAIETHDSAALKAARRKRHRLNRRIKRAMA